MRFLSKNLLEQKKYYLLSIFSLLSLHFAVFSQKNDTLHHAHVELGGVLSTEGLTPLWMRSLQYGAVPYQNPGGILKAYIGKNYFVPSKRFHRAKTYDWRYELEGVGFLGKENDFRLVQAYVAGKRKKWEFWLGRRKEIIGLGDSTLSSGFYAWSGNALPPVKYHIGTTDYMDLFQGNIGLLMSYSDGLQDNSGPTMNAYIHQKALYGRIGKRTARLNLFGGLNHNVSWGGERKLKTGGESDLYPSNLSTYFYVITALKDRTLVEIDPNTSSDDAGNQYGNHLGSIDLALKLQTNLGTLLLYKQTAYETGRISSLSTANDGITGISWKNPDLTGINHVVLEYIYTANQGNYTSGLAQILGLKDSQLSQIEGYYNNGGRGGWHYQGKGLGNPLLPIDRESNLKQGYAFSYNAVKAIYAGLGGNFPNGLTYQLRASYSLHGIPRNHLSPRLRSEDMLSQTAMGLLVKGTYQDRYHWTAQLGYDRGERLENSLGGGLSVRYVMR
jgi:hypothetical protein